MKYHFGIFIIYVLLFLIACKSNKSKEDIVVRKTILNDTVNTRVEIYSPDKKKLNAVYYYKDSMRHGGFEEYYANGRLHIEGTYYNDLIKGYVHYYDSSTGQLSKMIDYVVLQENDSFISKVNMVFEYDEDGNLNDIESVYYLDRIWNDTIKNGDDYAFGIKVFQLYYSKCYIVLGDFDSYFNLKSEGIEKKEFSNSEVILSTKNYHLGENTIRGIIKCHEKIGDINDSTFLLIFYEKDFYVLP